MIVALVRPSCSPLFHPDSGLVTGKEIKSALVELHQLVTVGSSYPASPELAGGVGDAEVLYH
jgi:hypothetical protein